VIFVLSQKARWSPVDFLVMDEVDVQKSYASRRLVQAQPRPSGLKVQSAQDIRFRMPNSLDMVLERASESGVFCLSVEDLVPVRGKDSGE